MNLIDKLCWSYLKDRKALFVRSKGKDAFYAAGGKREAGETDEAALIREVKEELSVDLIPGTISYLETFTAQAHGQPEGVMVQMKYFTADFTGELTPSAEIEEIDWLISTDTAKTTIPGKLYLAWLKERDLID